MVTNETAMEWHLQFDPLAMPPLRLTLDGTEGCVSGCSLDATSGGIEWPRRKEPLLRLQSVASSGIG